MQSEKFVSDKHDPFVLDRPILVLSCIAFTTSVAIFVIAMLDLGLPFFFLNPIFSGITILFLSISLFLRGRSKRRQEATDLRRLQLPPYAIPCEVISYLLSVAWLAPLTLSIVASIPGGPLGPELLKKVVEGNRFTLVAQGILAVVNFIFMGSIAILQSIERRRYDRTRDSALFRDFTIE
ncbi:hypothetical protein BDN72DRAFT_841226 [Pluteus cervinus]|uniref:Uncharacterized protein n=1 Tax=Pluteus cervinus TaxID=181527 RepID=A0ACD3AU93_9AGAR|nr:hypothetical protein BDN72DRAFT_841226 [Pluteus cervinus]